MESKSCKHCGSVFAGKRAAQFCSHPCSTEWKRAVGVAARMALTEKVCCVCKQAKSISEFAVKSRAESRWANECKSCHRAMRRANYDVNREQGIRQAKASTEKRKAAYKALKSGLKCERCGFSHPAALHFHHTDPTTKEFGLAAAVRRGFSETRIRAEIAKCVVLCANCHAIEHHGEQFPG